MKLNLREFSVTHALDPYKDYTQVDGPSLINKPMHFIACIDKSIYI